MAEQKENANLRSSGFDLLKSYTHINLPDEQPNFKIKKTSAPYVNPSKLSGNEGNNDERDNNNGIEPERGKESVTILTTTFVDNSVLKFSAKNLETLRRVTGVQKITLRSSSLGGEYGKVNLNSDNRGVWDFNATIVLDSDKIKRESGFDPGKYAENINRVTTNMVRKLAIRSQIDKAKNIITEPDEHGLSVGGFEELTRKVIIAMGTVAAPLFASIALFPRVAATVIENTAKYQMGISGLNVNPILASVLMIGGGIFLSEIYDYVTKLIGLGNYSPILFHRAALAFVMTDFMKIVKPSK